MSGNVSIKNGNGNVIDLQNPDTNTSDKTIDVSDLENRLGKDQTPQELFSSRTSGVIYTNNTDKPILVSVVHNSSAVRTDALQISSDGITWIDFGRATTANSMRSTCIVPAGYMYRAFNIQTSWSELRD